MIAGFCYEDKSTVGYYNNQFIINYKHVNIYNIII